MSTAWDEKDKRLKIIFFSLFSSDFTRFTRKCFRVKNAIVRESMAEILSTFLLITFGCGSVAQAVLSRQEDKLSIHLSWGLAVLMGCLVAGKVSGMC